MKRFFSILLTIAMLTTLVSAFAVNASAATVISNSSPAITANVGTAINLSGYSVVFDGDTSATSNITWKNGSTTITSFTPSAKGVTKLTATSGSKSKTIYVVAKNASDTEYVLYEANMSSFANITALKNAGWTLPSAASAYSISGGALKLIATSAYGGGMAFLPAWLADFGDYNITTEAKVDSCYNNDTSRWLSVMYRATTPADSPTYYHYCIRDAASSNGVEFTERIAGDAYWNVVAKSSAKATTLQDAYHTFGVQAYGNQIKYSLDGRQCHYMTASTYDSKVTVKNTKGYIGIQSKGLTLSVKSVKVTVQAAAPELERAFDLININHDKGSLIDSYANIQTVAGASYASVLAGEKSPGIAYINASEVADFSALFKACIAAKTIPTLYVTTNAQADSIIAAMNSNAFEDVTVISNSASVLSYLRGKKSIVRTGLKINLTKGILTSKEAHAIRVQVRSAPATFCVIESTYATKQAVAELQELAVAVWVNIASTPGTEAYDLEAVKAITSGANGFISQSSSALVDVINKTFLDGTMVRTPVVIGHRGNPSQAAENSMESFRAAYKNGADIFELDCYVTSDNRIVIFHDWSLTSTAGLTTAPSTLTTGLNNMTLAQIQQYTYSTGEKIPTLDDVLAEFKNADIRIYVEFKGGNQAKCVELTSKLIKQYDMEDRCDVICSATGFLTETYKSSNMYGMSTGYLCYPEPATVTDMTTALESLYNGLVMAQPVNSTLNQLCNRTNGGWFGQAATDRGMTVWPWGYGLSAINTAFFTGCDGITVDHAEWFTNLAKDVYATDFKMAVGQYAAGGMLNYNTWGRTTHKASAGDLVYSVVTGDCVKVDENGKLVAVSEGTATVTVGLVTYTTTGSKYILYAQPITVTVDGSKEALAPVIEAAKNVDVFTYTQPSLVAIRELYEKATALYSSASPSKAEITSVCAELSALLNDTCYSKIVSNGAKYTTTANTRTDIYADDGKKLVDGTKGCADGGSSASSGWGGINQVEVTLDLGDAIKSNEYNAYIVGGAWGIPNPESSKLDLTVSYSVDGSSYTAISADEVTTVLSGTGEFDGNWSAFKLNVVSNDAVTARYIKFTFDFTGNHLWMDEVEVIYNHGTPAAESVVYVDGFNSKILSGNCYIFTSEMGKLTVDNANHVWTQNVRAKWNSELGAYVVTEVFHGTGADTTPSFTLAADEILIAAHSWEETVAGSDHNAKLLGTAKVGDTVTFYGVDVASRTVGIAPSLDFGHEHVAGPDATCVDDQVCTLCGEVLTPAHGNHTEGDDATCVDDQVCTVCGEVLAPAHGNHTEGEWETLEDGSKELRCEICGELLDSEDAPPAYEPGDVTGDGKINMFDYMLVKSYCLGKADLTDEQVLRADINADGRINMFDYIQLKSIVMTK